MFPDSLDAMTRREDSRVRRGRVVKIQNLRVPINTFYYFNIIQQYNVYYRTCIGYYI